MNQKSLMPLNRAELLEGWRKSRRALEALDNSLKDLKDQRKDELDTLKQFERMIDQSMDESE